MFLVRYLVVAGVYLALFAYLAGVVIILKNLLVSAINTATNYIDSIVSSFNNISGVSSCLSNYLHVFRIDTILNTFISSLMALGVFWLGAMLTLLAVVITAKIKTMLARAVV